MKKILFSLIGMLVFLTGAMADNLVVNGEFERLDAKGQAIGWTVEAPAAASVRFFAHGAPDGGYVRIALPAAGNFSLRQDMSRVLRPNTKYEVSFKLRGDNFQGKVLGMVFINEGWTQNSGNTKLVPTAQWKKYKAVFTTPDFKKYTALVFYGSKVQGSVELADVEVEELDND